MKIADAVKTAVLVALILTVARYALVRWGGPLRPIGAAIPGGM